MSQKHLVTVSCPKFTVFSHVLDIRGSAAMDRLFFPNPKSKTVSSRVYLTQAPLSSQRPPLRRVNLYFDARFGFLGFTCFFFRSIYRDERLRVWRDFRLRVFTLSVPFDCASLPARHLLFSPLSCLTFLTSFGRKRSRDTIEELGRRVDYVRDLLCCAYISHHRTARHTQDTQACTHVQSDRRAGRNVFLWCLRQRIAQRNRLAILHVERRRRQFRSYPSRR